MAFLALLVEDKGTLRLNEFFDYDGRCFALSRSRIDKSDVCMDFLDFYEGDAGTEKMENVPVIFLIPDAETNNVYICGWYLNAVICKKEQRPSLFMEGNIAADSRNVVFLPEEEQKHIFEWRFSGRQYNVVESDDSRYQDVIDYISHYSGKNDFEREELIRIAIDPSLRRDHELCIRRCEESALLLMQDKLGGIRDIKELLAYADQAVLTEGKDPDGYYYQAMAYYNLGKMKKAVSAVNKAIEKENDAPEFIALKGCILAGMNYHDAGADLLNEAYMISGDDDYLIEEGRVWMLKGRMDKAYKCFKSIKDKDLLKECGIDLKNMEKKWPFAHIRGLSFKHFFQK